MQINKQNINKFLKRISVASSLTKFPNDTDNINQ